MIFFPRLMLYATLSEVLGSCCLPSNTVAETVPGVKAWGGRVITESMELLHPKVRCLIFHSHFSWLLPVVLLSALWTAEHSAPSSFSMWLPCRGRKWSQSFVLLFLTKVQSWKGLKLVFPRQHPALRRHSLQQKHLSSLGNCPSLL